jgi:hypothetical protein
VRVFRSQSIPQEYEAPAIKSGCEAVSKWLHLRSTTQEVLGLQQRRIAGVVSGNLKYTNAHKKRGSPLGLSLILITNL